MKENSFNLSIKKQKAVLALVSEPSIQRAAMAAKVGETTLHRWLHDDLFLEALHSAKREFVGHAINRLQQASGGAVTVLVEIMDDQDNPPSTRVSAAKIVLEMAFKSTEFESLEVRLAAIEDRLRQVFQWSG